MNINNKRFLPIVGLVFLSSAFLQTGCAVHDVKVVNDPTAPVPVHDSSSINAVSLGTRLTVSDGRDNSSGVPNSTFYTVPSDKRLVIEFVSIVVLNALFDETYQGEITTTVGGRTVRWFLETFTVGCKSERCAHTFSQPVRIYADPGTSVKAFVVRDTFREDDVVDVNISGHLIDL